MAAPATSVDTATGQIEPPPGKTYFTTGKETGSRRLTFTNTFEHYITNTNGVPTVATVTNLVPTMYAGLEAHEGLYVVPYHNRGIAMQRRVFNRITQVHDKIKIHKMGFRMKKVSCLQENLTTRASTTILENTFQSRPSCFMYIDEHHKFDNLVGEPNLTSYLTDNAFNPCLSDPQSVYPSFAAICPTRVTSNADMFKEAATTCWANNQFSGSLINCSMYYQNLGDNTTWTMHEHIPAHEFGEPNGDPKTNSFTWINPKPEWERIQGYGFQVPRAEQFSMPGETVNGNPLWSSRERALSMVYRGVIHPECTDDAVEISVDRVEFHRGSDEYGSQGPMSESYSPPYVYLKVEPMQGPTGPVTFIFRILMEYFIEIEVAQDTGTPAWVQCTPFNAQLDNATTIQHGLTFANPRMHVGTGAGANWDNSAISKRALMDNPRDRQPSPTYEVHMGHIRNELRPTRDRQALAGPRGNRLPPPPDRPNRRRQHDDDDSVARPSRPRMDPPDSSNDLPNTISNDVHDGNDDRFRLPELPGN